MPRLIPQTTNQHTDFKLMYAGAGNINYRV